MVTDFTIQLISKALDAASMRQTAIANNISNLHTPHYQAIDVNFEEQFKTRKPQQTQPFYEETWQAPVLEEQLASSVTNTTQYRALIKGLNIKLAITKLALQGSR